MKKVLLSAGVILGIASASLAQNNIIIDTVVTGPNYQTNKWYSLDNDETAAAPATEWHMSLSTSFSQSGEMTAAAHFNHKNGSLYTVPGQTFAANFNALDTTGMVANGPLLNSDSTWAKGAFNDVPKTGVFDFYWADYDMNTHLLNPTRVYVMKLGSGANVVYKKVAIALNPVTGKYTVYYADLDATSANSLEITLADYNTKNFVYVNVVDGTVLDREPAKNNWDFYFSQYMGTLSPTMSYQVAGVLHNHGVEVAQVNQVDVDTHYDFASQTFSSLINTIGFDWKSAGQAGVTIQDSIVYYVKSIQGEIWKVVFTGFVSGAANGNSAYIFSKEKVSSLGINETKKSPLVAVYPNPASNNVQLVLDASNNSKVEIFNLMGGLVYSQDLSAGLQTVNVSTSDFSTGVYQVISTVNGKASTQKLVVQH